MISTFTVLDELSILKSVYSILSQINIKVGISKAFKDICIRIIAFRIFTVKLNGSSTKRREKQT